MLAPLVGASAVVFGILNKGVAIERAESTELSRLHPGVVTVADEPSLSHALDRASRLAGFRVAGPAWLPEGSAVSSIYVNLDPRAPHGPRAFTFVMMNIRGTPGFGLDQTSSPFTLDEKANLALETTHPGVRVFREQSNVGVTYTLLTASRGFIMHTDPGSALAEAVVLKVLLSLPRD